MNRSYGIAGRIAEFFVNSKLTILVVLASILLGGMAVLLLPREEEPQIIVPMIDVFVQAPGMTAKEVEERVAKPMEKLLWEIPGVEYLYSTSSPGFCMIVVRFLVGQDEETGIVKTFNKLYSHFDLIPPGILQRLIKPRWIDDVPVLALRLVPELHHAHRDHDRYPAGAYWHPARSLALPRLLHRDLDDRVHRRRQPAIARRDTEPEAGPALPWPFSMGL